MRTRPPLIVHFQNIPKFDHASLLASNYEPLVACISRCCAYCYRSKVYMIATEIVRPLPASLPQGTHRGIYGRQYASAPVCIRAKG